MTKETRPPPLRERYRRHRSIVEKTSQLAASARVLELTQRFRLDLADALAGHGKLLADFLQRMVRVHAYSEAHAQNPLFARGQRSKHARGCLAQIGLDRRVDPQHRVLVLDEIAEVAVFLVADRRLEADRLLGD